MFHKDRQGDMIAVLENKLSEQGAIWEEPDGTLHSISVIYQNPESQIWYSILYILKHNVIYCANRIQEETRMSSH